MTQKVAPFIIRWPRKWVDDNDVRPVIEYLNEFLHDLWVRSGGPVDQVADTEAALVTGNGENRGYRRFEDMITDLEGRVTEAKRNTKSCEQICHELGEKIEAKSRKINELEARINGLDFSISDLKSSSSIGKQLSYDLSDQVGNLRRHIAVLKTTSQEIGDEFIKIKHMSRKTEQATNEIIERYDNGT